MAIEPELLSMRYGDVSLAAKSLTVAWQVYHAQTDSVVGRGTVTARLYAPNRVNEAWREAVNQARSEAANVLAVHEPIAAIGGRSSFDADLVLDGWLSDPVARTMVHPVCGTILGVDYGDLVGFVNAVLAERLPPPAWFWAEGTATGVRVRCVAVPGASLYAVFDGIDLLGTVPGAGWNEVLAEAGPRSIRMAGVVGGQVGILSFPVAVQVGEEAALRETAVLPGPVGTKPRSRLGRFLRDPFGVLPDG